MTTIVASDVEVLPAEGEPTKALAKGPRRVPPVSTRWRPGQSGNPKGYGKDHAEVRKAAQAHGVEAVNKLVELMRTGPPKVQAMACLAILDRGFGKAAITVDDGTGRALGGVIFLPAPQEEP